MFNLFEPKTKRKYARIVETYDRMYGIEVLETTWAGSHWEPLDDVFYEEIDIARRVADEIEEARKKGEVLRVVE